MTRSDKRRIWIGGIDLWMTLAVAVVAIAIIVAATQVEAQTFTVLHSFTGGADGAYPRAGLTLDRAGNLYGTTEGGGEHGWGVVFKLKRTGSSWLLSPLYSFAGAPNDGADPESRVVFGPDGSLYGTTADGGTDYAGTVFKLNPAARACNSAICPWTETQLHIFPDPEDTDGFYPSGDLTIDPQGNIYGTTSGGGAGDPYGCDGLGCGVVYEVSQTQGNWNESVLYAFTGSADGGVPSGGVIFDHSGKLYGTASFGNGTIFQLASSQSGWSLNNLYTFMRQSDGWYPDEAGVFDASGNLYVSSADGGGGGTNGGAVVELQRSSGWSFNLVYAFTSNNGRNTSGTLVMDAAGNLYGTSGAGGMWGVGAVFKLTPTANGWTYSTLHDFTPNGSDGFRPVGGVVMDAAGNLYGTSSAAGAGGVGVVWEITP